MVKNKKNNLWLPFDCYNRQGRVTVTAGVTVFSIYLYTYRVYIRYICTNVYIHIDIGFIYRVDVKRRAMKECVCLVDEHVQFDGTSHQTHLDLYIQ